MAFVYEVNGVKVQFDHEPTDADIDEAALNLGTSKAKPKSERKVTETAGGAAIVMPNITGRRPASQNDREASAEMGLQTVRGIASNVPAIAGIPGSVINAVANAPRTAQDISNRYQKAQEAFTGQAPQVQPLPEYNQVTPYDMNYFAQMVPGPQPSSPQGKGFEGYMENLGASYKQDPYKGVVDAITGVGGMALTGMPTPLSAIGKSVPALAARTLQKATQFEPGFEAAAVHAAQGRAGLEANMPPQTPALPAPAAVQPQAPIPMPGPQRNVNIEGQSFTLPNKIDVSNSQSASPKQKSMAIAASKIQPVQPAVPEAAPAPTPTPQPQVQPTQVAQPVVPEGYQPPPKQPTVAERIALMRKMQEENKKPTVEKQQTPAQMEREQKQQAAAAEKSFNESVISDFAQNGTSDKIDHLSQTNPIDVSKAVYNESNATRGMADWLLKHGVDSIPMLPGMTESQIVNALFKEMTGKGAKKGVKPSLDELRAKAAAKKAPDNVSQMMIGEEIPKSKLEEGIVNKRTFNKDMQKYRYGSSKEPLTYEEFKHLESSDFIEKQDITDILKGIETRHTEHSMWYKDKNGVTKNVDAHNGRLTVTEIDKKNPNREITYSKDNPSDEDHWYFHKTVRENGAKVSHEKFEVTDTFSPRHEKLKDWPEEFKNSKYDYE